MRWFHDQVEQPTPGTVSRLLHKMGVSRSPQEVGWVLTAGNSGHVHSLVEVARGTARKLQLHLPTIIGAVVVSGADRFVFIHNHPGKVVTPSKADIALTQQISDAATVAGLYLEDHLIVTPHPDVYLSMKHAGYFGAA